MSSADGMILFHMCGEGVGEENEVGLDIIEGDCCEGVAWVKDGIAATAVICGTDNVDCADTSTASRVKKNTIIESRGIIVKPYQVMKTVDSLLCILSSTMLRCSILDSTIEVFRG